MFQLYLYVLNYFSNKSLVIDKELSPKLKKFHSCQLTDLSTIHVDISDFDAAESIHTLC